MFMQIARELQPQPTPVVAPVSHTPYRSHTRLALRAVPPPIAAEAAPARVHSAAAASRATLGEFERAVLPHRASLSASARRLAKSRADADDLVQETLLRAWRFWPRYNERDHCRAWLQRILTNTFCSMCRSTARRRAQLSQLALASSIEAELAPEPALEPQAERTLCRDDQLASSLAALKPEQRRILCLIDLNERSYREAARELACPIGTVMSRLHRARRALRSQLAAAAVRA
jgi:RNA polymerase sigma-70 factor (ECF subfamily)